MEGATPGWSDQGVQQSLYLTSETMECHAFVLHVFKASLRQLERLVLPHNIYKLQSSHTGKM